LAAKKGTRVLVITGSSASRATPLMNELQARDIEAAQFSVAREPTIALIEEATALAKAQRSELIISFGGGSVLDAGKAIAALATNPGSPRDYLEVIGKGQPLQNAPLPFIAIPTTAGTGSEVTKNAVLSSPEYRVKVSLRSDAMLADIALVDPVLTYSVPPTVTATTGMDALTQVIEPFVSHHANPLTDALCREALPRAARAIRRVYQNGNDAEAREAMALASLFGGLALANAKLGAVHGFAGALGGMYDAPHGAICAALLPHVMATNVQALDSREADNPLRARFDEVAQMLTGRDTAVAADGVAWIQETVRMLQIPTLGTHGIQAQDFTTIIEKSSRSSSMKGNPLPLTEAELTTILENAL